jgi:Protein of unknown function (DUF3467)
MSLNGAADLSARADQPEVNLGIPPEMFPGVWANYAQVAQTEHEVTLDFYRIGPGGQQGIAVSRVNCSPILLEQLVRDLTRHREAYASRASTSPPGSSDD